MDHPKYSHFRVLETTYKSIGDHSIKVFVLIPKALIGDIADVGKRPLLVKIHGGGLVQGAAMFPDWFSSWSLEYTLKHSAVMVTPDYRLMPEATGLEIVEDMADFWTWVLDGSLQRTIDDQVAGIEVDLAHILAYGDSAGGYLALQSGFLRPREINAVLSVFPMTSNEGKVTPFGNAPTPTRYLDEFLASIKPGAVVSSATPPGEGSAVPLDRDRAFTVMAEQGIIQDFIGHDDRVVLMKALENTPAMPPTLVIHGADDTLVPVDGSRNFVAAAQRKFGPKACWLVERPGDHGFDGTASIHDPWLKECLEDVSRLWLQ
ncbi:hypothetical protein HDU83_006220 [Entophlyctis luteolus]|nr:hypothetical protein HDU83_006220 [Entophlyctis luteolus]